MITCQQMSVHSKQLHAFQAAHTCFMLDMFFAGELTGLLKTMGYSEQQVYKF